MRAAAHLRNMTFVATVAGFCFVGAATAQAQVPVMAFKQAVAEAAAGDDAVAAFYRDRDYAPLWTGASAEATLRRAALMDALRGASVHALPVADYDVIGLMADLGAARSNRDLGLLEAELTRKFLRYARDIHSGVLNPIDVDDGIKREAPVLDRAEMLSTFAQERSPRDYIRSLAPKAPEYTRLMKEKIRLETLLAGGGWGASVPIAKIEPGDRGDNVVALRDRLIALGYLRRSASDVFDETLQRAVQNFQSDHGLLADGVAGEGTLKEINVSASTRLQQVVVAMERERWMNIDRGDRHVLVNLTDFTAKIVDHGEVTFETRSVIGANSHDRRSPEFSDEMDHMVINPSWYVPRSIATKEYLPQLQRNPNSVRHLVITDVRGQQVDRENVDFTQFNTRNFPFDMRQPPSRSNALGLVKFMFPNKYNIYLHDTPAKNLFSRESRAYSHGCIRLNDPFDFAYALLAAQEDDPVGFFQSKLRSGGESRVDLEEHLPVHIIYRTALTTMKGGLQFRRDVYGRDGRIFAALADAGVVLSELDS